MSAEPLDCSEPHRWETYAVGRLAETTTSPSEGAVGEDPAVLATCTSAALRSYLDGAKSKFRASVIPPTELQFSQGARRFACVARGESGEETTGSLRDR